VLQEVLGHKVFRELQDQKVIQVTQVVLRVQLGLAVFLVTQVALRVQLVLVVYKVIRAK